MVESRRHADALLVEPEPSPERLGGPALQREGRQLRSGLRADSSSDVSAYLGSAGDRAARGWGTARLACPIEDAFVVDIQSGGNSLSAPVGHGRSGRPYAAPAAFLFLLRVRHRHSGNHGRDRLDASPSTANLS